MLYVIYGKFIDDKADGVYLAGVYFGGLGTSQHEAEAIARECVNTLKGGSIIPKIFPVVAQNSLLDVMVDATEKFERLESQMVAVEEILNRAGKRK